MQEKYQCKFIKENGQRCRATKQRNSDYCIYHDAERKKEKKTIIDEITDGYFIDLGLNTESWDAWKTILKGIFNIYMTDEEKKIWKDLTDLNTRPQEAFQTVFITAGRRSGKSFIGALVSVYMALQDWSKYVRAGEPAEVVLIAGDREQAGVCFGYVDEILSQKNLKRHVRRRLQTKIGLKNGITISIRTASFRGIRGRTIVCCVMDELAFYRDQGANPDAEIIRAIRPSMLTVPGSLLLGISSPYLKSGVLWEAYKNHYGKKSDTLVIKGSTVKLNPTANKEWIQQEMKNDPASKSEYLAEFREDLEAFLPGDLIQQAVIEGREVLKPEDGLRYQAFVDPAGGSGQDSFTLSICHRDRKTKKIILDLVFERKPRFSPNTVIKEISRILKMYGIRKIHGDKYAGGFVEEGFRKNGIQYASSEWTKSQLYLEFQPLLISGEIELLENERMMEQFQNLERTYRKGTCDMVDHPKWGNFKDDVSNAVAGCIVHASQKPVFNLDDPEIEMSLPISSKIFNEDIPGDPVPGWYKAKPGEKVIEIDGQKRVFRDMPSLKERMQNENTD
jgi:hypothetical protein